MFFYKDMKREVGFIFIGYTCKVGIASLFLSDFTWNAWGASKVWDFRLNGTHYVLGMSKIISSNLDGMFVWIRFSTLRTLCVGEKWGLRMNRLCFFSETVLPCFLRYMHKKLLFRHTICLGCHFYGLGLRYD